MTDQEGREKAVPPPRAHGGDAGSLALALGVSPNEILDLSMTMNPLARDVVPLVRRAADSVRRYPDPDVATAAFAEAIGTQADRLLLTNGGAEAIALVAMELGEAEIIEPEFSLWRRHLRGTDVGVTAGTRRVRSNPNNPTGMLARDDEVAQCWDEAFFPLATGRWTRGDADRDAIVVGSLTKLFACPGLRLGYVITPNLEVRERLLRSQIMWSVNALALAVLPELIAGIRLEKWASEISSLRSSLATIFVSRGFVVDVADAPWILVRDAVWLREALARQRILVRDCASFGLDETVRIAVPGSKALKRVAQELDRVLDARR
jgi:threonine-phosphate decarboxylase